jgi:hypothetical protein
MEERKPEISQVESVPVAEHNHTIEALAVNEDEPQTPYQLGWKTIFAVLTLSMGNVCAACSLQYRTFHRPLDFIPCLTVHA